MVSPKSFFSVGTLLKPMNEVCYFRIYRTISFWLKAGTINSKLPFVNNRYQLGAVNYKNVVLP